MKTERLSAFCVMNEGSKMTCMMDGMMDGWMDGCVWIVAKRRVRMMKATRISLINS